MPAGPVESESPGPRPLDDLARDICSLAAHLAAATCRWLLLIAEFDAREGWAEAGLVSCAHWLSWRCGIGLGTAREHVRVARALGCLPLTREAFGTGELSYSKVRAVTRVADDATEAQLVEYARHATGSQLERIVCGFRSALDATVDRAHAQEAKQRLDWNWDEDGMLCVRGRLRPEDGRRLLSALSAAEAEVEPAVLEQLGAPARRAQAFVRLVTGETTVEPVACELVVHVDADSLRGDELVVRSEVEDGPSIAPETARRLGCDAAVVTMLERGGEPLSVGRRTRSIPPALRRALRSRDSGGCASPGVTTDAICTHITSGTGPAAASPLSTTSCSCAAITIGSFTRVATAWLATNTDRFASLIGADG